MEPVLSMGNGGARPNSGPKKKGRPSNSELARRAAEELNAADPFATLAPPIPPPLEVPIGEESSNSIYGRSRAAVEQIKARNAELDFQVKMGLYVSRAAVQRASTETISMFAQAMRSMKDDLERKLALSPEIVEAIDDYVNLHMDRLAKTLAMLGGA